MTFIALEGPDGAGKSTLARAVMEELYTQFPGDEVYYLHASQLKRDPFDEYALSMENYRPGAGIHWVLDRWHWGETIYGPLYREKSALTVAGFRWVELFLAARGATVWHVTASLETIQDRLETRGEDYLQPGDVFHVWEGFSTVAEKSLTFGGTAETDKHDPHKLAKAIVKEAEYKESQATPIFRHEYIGRSLPNFLLVGDKQGNGDPGVTKAPFMPRGTSSGTFLLESLPEMWWHQVGIVNANETDLPKLMEDLLDPPVIALGRNASDALLDHDIEHAAVPHPSFVRRFHNSKQQDYGVLIRNVSTTGAVKLSWPN
jgi:hypothetical protein